MNQPAMNQPAPAPKSPHTGAFVFAGVIIALFFIGLMGLLYYGCLLYTSPSPRDS